jgi:hypothetical protein
MRIVKEDNCTKIYPFVGDNLTCITVIQPNKEVERLTAEIGWGSRCGQSIEATEQFMICMIEAVEIAKEYNNNLTF